MYINHKYLKESDLVWHDVYALQLVKQGDGTQLFKQEYEDLLELGYLTLIKGKKSNLENQKLRLSDRGKEFLENIEEAEEIEEDVTIFEWLCAVYKNLGKEIGSKKKTLSYIKDFRVKSGIEKNRLASLCNAFINDENQMEYSNILQNVFYKPVNVYATRFNLEDSRLWKYYLKHEQEFQEEWKKEIYNK
jgi:hypothetical protein